MYYSGHLPSQDTIMQCNLKEKLAYFANWFTCPVIEGRNVNSTKREMGLGLPHSKWL